MNTIKKSTFKSLVKLVPDKKARYFQTVPEVQKTEAPTPGALVLHDSIWSISVYDVWWEGEVPVF
jgi:hypothetical protein